MPVTVNINGLSCVHQTSGGIATATLPDVCKTPPYSTPVPYPNIALSSDLVGGTTSVTVDGSPAAIQSSMFVKSTGDEPGALGGVVSQVFAMEATFLSFSPTVLFEGQPACRLTDKMLMNKGNTVCMSGVMQCVIVDPASLPPESVEIPDPEKPLYCPIHGLYVGCGHEDRDQVIDRMTQDQPVLQVITTRHKPDKLVVKAYSSCGFGNPQCPTVMVCRPDGKWEPMAGSGSFELKSSGRGKTWGELMTTLFSLGELPHDTYLFRPMICNGHGKVDVPLDPPTWVEVFEELEGKGELTVGYSHPKMDENDLSLKYDPMSTWKVTGSLSGKYGQREFKFDPEHKAGPYLPLPLVGSLLDLLARDLPVFDALRRFGIDVKGEILFPDVVFSMGVELAELPDKPLVGANGYLKLEGKPLFGLELKVSILEILIRWGGALFGPGGALVGQILVELKNRFAEGVKVRSAGDQKARGLVEYSLDIDIELSTQGRIDAKVDISLTGGRPRGDPEITFSGLLGLKLEGRVIGKAKTFVFEAAAGAKLGLAAAKGEGSEFCGYGVRLVADLEGSGTAPEVYFTGMAVYYVLYAEMGKAGAESEKKDSPPSKSRLKKAHERPKVDPDWSHEVENSFKSSAEYKGTYVLLEPWAWKWGENFPQPSG